MATATLWMMRTLACIPSQPSRSRMAGRRGPNSRERTRRGWFGTEAREPRHDLIIVQLLTIGELGAGTATRTGPWWARRPRAAQRAGWCRFRPAWAKWPGWKRWP